MRTLTIKDIPDDILRGFKAYCALSDKSMNEVLIDYMKEKSTLVVLKDEEPKDKE